MILSNNNTGLHDVTNVVEGGVIDLQQAMSSVPIATNVVSSNPAHGEVYSMQHYVKRFVIDLWQVCGFLQVLRFPPPIKLTAMI